MSRKTGETGGPMPIYVISLDRSVERFSSFLQRNAHLGDSTRARAVDGACLDRNDLLARGVLSREVGYTNASLGCAVSHACLWQIASAMDGPMTIAEDDALFRHDFRASSHALIATLPSDWDFVLWGWNFNSLLCIDLLPGIASGVLLCDQDAIRQNVMRFQQTDLPLTAHRLLRSHGCICYSVSPEGAKRLLELCLPIRDLNVWFPVANVMTPNDGIDMMMSLAYPEMKAFVSVPPLVVTENRPETSTIQGQG